jgi:hypothetical protein
MVFRGVAEPEQLAMLREVVDDHCREAGIDPASEERDEIARLVMSLFNNGASTAAELKAALLARSNQQARRFG